MNLIPADTLIDMRARMNVRSGKLPWYTPPPQFRGRGRYSAYNSGFEAGFRNWDFLDPYVRFDCSRAYTRGYQDGAKLAVKMIAKEEKALRKTRSQ